VVGKDVIEGTVFVAEGASHPALLTTTALLRHPTWVAGKPPEPLVQVLPGPPTSAAVELCSS
jgi:hypothetical protein